MEIIEKKSFCFSMIGYLGLEQAEYETGDDQKLPKNIPVKQMLNMTCRLKCINWKTLHKLYYLKKNLTVCKP